MTLLKDSIVLAHAEKCYEEYLRTDTSIKRSGANTDFCNEKLTQ